MPDAFVSFSTSDREFAEFVHGIMISHGLTAFVAPLSLQPGDMWTKAVWENLRNSDWVIFLASKQASTSAYVQQELGGALGAEKKLVPIVWDMDPSELPGWVNQTQALDLRNLTVVEVRERVDELGKRLRANKAKGQLVAWSVVGALLLLATKE